MENMYKTMKFQNDYYKKIIKRILKMNNKHQSEIAEYKRAIANLESQLTFSNSSSNNRANVGAESTKVPQFLKDTDLHTSQSPFKRQRGESVETSSTRSLYHNVSPTPTTPYILPSSNAERGSLKFGNTMLPPSVRGSKIFIESSSLNSATTVGQERPTSAHSDTFHGDRLINESQYKSIEPMRQSDQTLNSNLQYQYQSQEQSMRQRPYTTGTQSVPDRVRSPMIRTSNITSRVIPGIHSETNRSIPAYTPNKNWSRPSS